MEATPELLSQSGTPVPLLGTRVHVDVYDVATRVRVTQEFHNTEALPVECTYRFPLDSTASVVHMEACINGEITTATLCTREQADVAYDDALAEGRRAAMVTQEAGDIFTMLVGNLGPGEHAAITLAYVAPLRVDDGDVRVTVPQTILPRYVGAGEGVEAAESTRVESVGSVPYRNHVELHLHLSRAVKHVASPTHPAQLDEVECGVRYALLDLEPCNDVVVVAAVEEPSMASVLVERCESDGHITAQLTWTPQWETPAHHAAQCEVVLVVDLSGSMSGSIPPLRNALGVALRSLPEGCHFNLVFFGSSFRKMWRHAQPYNDTTLAAAQREVDSLAASMGGTELLSCLRDVLHAALGRGMRREVVLFTDGGVSNTERCISEVRANNATTRVFTVGIGASYSHALVDGIATAGCGTTVSVDSAMEGATAKVVGLVQKCTQPSLTNVRITAPTLHSMNLRPSITRAFRGVPIMCLSAVDAGELVARPVHTVSVLATRADGTALRLQAEIRADRVHDTRTPTLRPLWARARMEETPPHDRSERERLSLAHHVLCKETSFVLVTQRGDTATASALVSRRVPVQAPMYRSTIGASWPAGTHAMMARNIDTMLDRGCAMADLNVQSANLSLAAASFKSKSSSLNMRMPNPFSAVGVAMAGLVSKLFRSPASKRSSAPPRAPMASPPPPEQHTAATPSVPAALAQRLVAILALQRSNGSFTVSEELAALLGVAFARVLAAAHGVDSTLSSDVIVTCAVCLHLHSRYASRRAEWTLCERKAIAFCADAWSNQSVTAAIRAQCTTAATATTA